MADAAASQALLMTSLERCAQTLGDITPHVIAAFYRHFPDAPARFEALWPGARHRLEGQMVEQALYCFLNWFESPGEIEILLISTIPHHLRTLEVDPAMFGGLIAALCETIAATIPAEAQAERHVWQAMRAQIEAIATREFAWVSAEQERRRAAG